MSNDIDRREFLQLCVVSGVFILLPPTGLRILKDGEAQTMATITASWTEDQAITFDDSTPAKTVEGKGVIDLAASGYIGVVIQFRITFGENADGNAEIRVRSSPDSGNTKDTILLFSQEVAFIVSTQKNITVTIMEQPYVEVGVYNGNTAVEDITIAADYAGLKYTSA